MEYLLHGPGQHQTYEKVANITDMFGPRLSGSQSLEDAAGRYSYNTVGHYDLKKSILETGHAVCSTPK